MAIPPYMTISMFAAHNKHSARLTNAVFLFIYLGAHCLFLRFFPPECSTWNIPGGFFVFLGVRTSTKGAAVL